MYNTEVLNLVVKTVLGNTYTVTDFKEVDDCYIIRLNRFLPKHLEYIFDILPKKLKKGVSYEVNYNFVWSFIRGASTILIHTNNFPDLKKLSLHLIDGGFRSLLKHILTSFDLKPSYDSTKIGEDKIIFSRMVQWVDSAEDESSVTIIPGLEYKYIPKAMTASISISYNCQFLWNWLLEIKYVNPRDLLKMSVFKSVESMVGSRVFKENR